MYYVPCILKGKFSFLRGTFFYPVKHIQDMFLINKVRVSRKTHSKKDNEEFEIVMRGIPQSLIDIYSTYENDTFEIVKPC